MKILSIEDLKKEEIEKIIELSISLKRGKKLGKVLRGKIGLLYFEKPSTRTRISFESAIKKMGGDTIYSTPQDTQISRGEEIEDFIRVVERYVDFIIARVYSHSTLEKMSIAKIPIINALSDLEHPTQIISDLATIKFIKGNIGKIGFFGDIGNNIGRSLLAASKILGIEVIFSGPEVDFVEEIKKSKYARYENDPEKAAREVDVIYTDVWFSMGQEYSKEKEEKMEKYRVDEKIIREGVIVLHCLPAKKGKEITEEVFSKFSDYIFLQSEMKMWSAMAILYHIFTKTKKEKTQKRIERKKN